MATVGARDLKGKPLTGWPLSAICCRYWTKAVQYRNQVMLRLSKLTDYAVVVLTRLAEGEDLQTSPAIASGTGIPEPTVAKVLKMLSARGLVVSARGARGGYRLLKPLSRIPVADVIQAMDGPIALTACVEGSALECSSRGLCPMHGRWDPVNAAITAALSAISLADMRAPLLPRYGGSQMAGETRLVAIAE